MRALFVLMVVTTGSTAHTSERERLPAIPDKEGFAGSFAGASNGTLLVAGGANFPNKKPWDGGKKRWYDTVFVLEKPGGEWKLAGKLPRPLGYGVSVTHGEGIVCVGGSDFEQHFADAFRLEWRAGKLVTTKLPPSPKPVANGCGALVGDTLYIAGGQEKPDGPALKNVWCIDLSAHAPQWKEVEACPGAGRILAVASGFGGSFWLASGAELVTKGDTFERKYLRDAYRYDPGQGWTKVADLPRAAVAAPSPAPTDATGFFVLGGDDGTQLGVAPEKHRGFAKSILRYDTKTRKWLEAGELSASRVTTPCVRWNGSWIIPSGEVRPGIRSPELWIFAPTK